MRAMKKWLAALLALAMILTGLYIVPGEADEAKATASNTETVSEEGATVEPGMLTVKVQPGTGTDAAGQTVNALRFITSVNSLEYKAVGFVIDWEGNTGDPITYAVKDNTVFERIESIAGESYMSYKYGPKVVDTSAEYFATGKLNVTGKESVLYTVTAYVVTFDDETVYGTSRCVSYDDAISTTYTNVSFVSDTDYDTSETEQETITGVTSSASSTKYSATVIGSDVYGVDENDNTLYNIHVRVPVNPNTLPSATVFTFGTDETAIYRNLYTTHTQAPDATETSTTAYADTSWYNAYKTVNSSETEFVIATTADLYGFSELVTAGTFGSATAYLCADLTVNTNTPTTDPQLAASWDNYTPQYSWTPAGTSSVQFTGTLDGVGHSISGLYADKATGNIKDNDTYCYTGLFASTDTTCTVEDVRILNSCFKAYRSVGSISGFGGGNFSAIYSNAVVQAISSGGTSERSGGIIGNVVEQASIKESEFAGTASSEWQQVGGIVGTVYGATLDLEDCLFSGIVYAGRTSGGINAGGLCGLLYNHSSTVLNATNCMVYGSVTYNTVNTNTACGEHIGSTQKNTSYNINYVVSMTGSCATNAQVGLISNGMTVNATSAPQYTSEELVGQNAYTNTKLGFWINAADENDDNVWIARSGLKPTLKRFADENAAMPLTSYIKADTRWYDNAEPDFAQNAAGSDANPYVIKDADDLYGLASLVNAAKTNFDGAYIVLANDITVNTNTPENADRYASWSGYAEKVQCEWIPIGNEWINSTGDYHFYGNFNGQGHTISGLYMAETNNNRWAGLFGVTGDNSAVSNLKLEDSYFETNAQGGSISGRGGGTFTNIESNAVVVGSAFTGEATGTVYTGTTIGGILGQMHENAVVMTNCHYSGEVKTAGSTAAGLVGYVGAVVADDGTVSNPSSLTLRDCSFTGTINCGSGYAGGIVAQIAAQTTASIEDCVSSGTLTAVGQYVGGIIGSVSGSADADVNKCAFTGNASAGVTRVGGLVGYINSATVDMMSSLVSGTLTTVQFCGGFVGQINNSDSETTYAITMTDCHLSGTVETTTEDKGQNAGGLCGNLTGYVTLTATRCLHTGYLKVARTDDVSFAAELIGQVSGAAIFDGTNGVYIINDTAHIPSLNKVFFKTHNLATGNSGWVPTANAGAGVSRKTVTQLTGANAVDNLPTLGIETTSTSTSTWVAIKDGFPTLRIFANADDIYTTE